MALNSSFKKVLQENLLIALELAFTLILPDLPDFKMSFKSIKLI